MPTLLKRIHVAIGAGAALWLGGAGCSDSIRRPPGADADIDAQMMTSDAAVEAGRDAIVGVDAADDARVGVDASIADAGVLLPYPLDALSCGSFDAGSFCCYYASCIAVVNLPCPTANDPALPFQPVDVTCGVTGPFAPNPEDVNAPVGNCCYVTGSQAAVGRPLLVAETMLVAPIVMRSDWLLG